MPRQRTLDAFLNKKNGSSDVKKPVKQSLKEGRPKPNKAPKPNRPAITDDSTSDSDIRGIHFSPIRKKNPINTVGSESDTDSLEVISPAKTRHIRQHKRAPDTPSGSELSADESGGDSEQPLTRNVKRKVTNRVADSDEDEQQDEPVEPKRRKLVRGKRPSSQDGESEDLMDEVEPDRIIQQRLRGTKKSTFSQKLDVYKRRKNGSSPLKPIEVSGDEDEDETGDEEEGVKPFEGARPDNGEDPLELEDDEDDFIVEDDEEVVELPLEFSRHSHQDLDVHFKVICQLFVHLAISPPEDRSQFIKSSMKNSYFSLPLTTVQRKLSSLRDSLVASNAWKPEFTSALRKYPGFDLSDLEFSVPLCDACKIGGRVSTLIGRSSGHPYNKSTFKPIEPGSDSSDDEDGNNVQEFNLGRFCARRAQAYHSITHWEYLLFDSLRSEVYALQHPDETLTGQAFIRVSWGGGMELPDDTDDPDQIMDWLDGRGILQAEWNKIKALMEGAHHLDSSRQAEED